MTVLVDPQPEAEAVLSEVIEIEEERLVDNLRNVDVEVGDVDVDVGGVDFDVLEVVLHLADVDVHVLQLLQPCHRLAVLVEVTFTLLGGYLECQSLAAAEHDQFQRLLALVFVDGAAQVPAVLDVLSAGGDDDVARLQARLLGGAVFRHLGDEDAPAVGDAEVLAELRVKLVVVDSDVAVAAEHHRELGGLHVGAHGRALEPGDVRRGIDHAPGIAATLPFTQRHGQSLALAFADEAHLDAVARFSALDGLDQVFSVVDRCVVDGYDHVAAAQAGVVRRAAAVDVSDICALGGIDVEHLGRLLREVRNDYAEFRPILLGGFVVVVLCPDRTMQRPGAGERERTDRNKKHRKSESHLLSSCFPVLPGVFAAAVAFHCPQIGRTGNGMVYTGGVERKPAGTGNQTGISRSLRGCCRRPPRRGAAWGAD